MSRTRLILRGTAIVLAGVILFLAGIRVATRRAARVGFPAADATADYGFVHDFLLVDQSSRTVTLGSLEGLTWVADFVFTRCAGPCPIVSKHMSDLAAQFKDKAGLRFVSFSVDPDYDSPAVLAKYAKNYEADPNRWLFLTGPKANVYRLIHDDFHLAAEPLPSQNPGEIDIMHSLYFALVNGEGRIIGVFDTNDAAAMDRLKRALKKLP
jgi:protein SCO1/2